MGGRIALGVLLVLAACKSKSDDASKATGGSAPPAVSTPAPTPPPPPGMGSSADGPITPTPVEKDAVRPADTKVGGETTVRAIAANTKVAPPTEPATPTPVTPDELARQQAPTAEPLGGSLGPPGYRPPPADNGKEKTPAGRIVIAKGESLDSSTLTVDDVSKKIRSYYLSAFRRCYFRVLVRDPVARGAVELRFTVNPSGRAVAVTTRAFVEELGACMKSAASAWTFRVPTSTRTMNPANARFLYSFVLTPD